MNWRKVESKTSNCFWSMNRSSMPNCKSRCICSNLKRRTIYGRLIWIKSIYMTVCSRRLTAILAYGFISNTLHACSFFCFNSFWFKNGTHLPVYLRCIVAYALWINIQLHYMTKLCHLFGGNCNPNKFCYTALVLIVLRFL